MSHWMTSGARRLKARARKNDHGSFAAEAQRRAAACGALDEDVGGGDGGSRGSRGGTGRHRRRTREGTVVSTRDLNHRRVVGRGRASGGGGGGEVYHSPRTVGGSDYHGGGNFAASGDPMLQFREAAPQPPPPPPPPFAPGGSLHRRQHHAQGDQQDTMSFFGAGRSPAATAVGVGVGVGDRAVGPMNRQQQPGFLPAAEHGVGGGGFGIDHPSGGGAGGGGGYGSGTYQLDPTAQLELDPTAIREEARLMRLRADALRREVLSQQQQGYQPMAMTADFGGQPPHPPLPSDDGGRRTQLDAPLAPGHFDPTTPQPPHSFRQIRGFGGHGIGTTEDNMTSRMSHAASGPAGGAFDDSSSLSSAALHCQWEGGSERGERNNPENPSLPRPGGCGQQQRQQQHHLSPFHEVESYRCSGGLVVDPASSDHPFAGTSSHIGGGSAVTAPLNVDRGVIAGVGGEGPDAATTKALSTSGDAGFCGGGGSGGISMFRRRMAAAAAAATGTEEGAEAEEVAASSVGGAIATSSSGRNGLNAIQRQQQQHHQQQPQNHQHEGGIACGGIGATPRAPEIGPMTGAEGGKVVGSEEGRRAQRSSPSLPAKTLAPNVASASSGMTAPLQENTVHAANDATINTTATTRYDHLPLRQSVRFFNNGVEVDEHGNPIAERREAVGVAATTTKGVGEGSPLATTNRNAPVMSERATGSRDARAVQPGGGPGAAPPSHPHGPQVGADDATTTTPPPPPRVAMAAHPTGTVAKKAMGYHRPQPHHRGRPQPDVLKTSPFVPVTSMGVSGAVGGGDAPARSGDGGAATGPSSSKSGGRVAQLVPSPRPSVTTATVGQVEEFILARVPEVVGPLRRSRHNVGGRGTPAPTEEPEEEAVPIGLEGLDRILEALYGVRSSAMDGGGVDVGVDGGRTGSAETASKNVHPAATLPMRAGNCIRAVEGMRRELLGRQQRRQRRCERSDSGGRNRSGGASEGVGGDGGVDDTSERGGGGGSVVGCDNGGEARPGNIREETVWRLFGESVREGCEAELQGGGTCKSVDPKTVNARAHIGEKVGGGSKNVVAEDERDPEAERCLGRISSSNASTDKQSSSRSGRVRKRRRRSIDDAQRDEVRKRTTDSRTISSRSKRSKPPKAKPTKSTPSPAKETSHVPKTNNAPAGPHADLLDEIFRGGDEAPRTEESSSPSSVKATSPPKEKAHVAGGNPSATSSRFFDNNTLCPEQNVARTGTDSPVMKDPSNEEQQRTLDAAKTLLDFIVCGKEVGP